VSVLALRFFREPPRRSLVEPGGAANVGAADAAQPRPRIADVIRDVGRALARRRELALVLLGGSLLCYGAGSALHAVTWLVQERGFTFSRAALHAGIIAVAAGFTGNLAGGLFGDWGAGRWRNGRLWCLAIMTAFFTPIGLVFYSLVPGTPLFYGFWFLTSAGTSAWFGPLYSAVQELSPQHTRSTLIAFALLVMNMLGVGPGALVTGMFGDARSLSLGLTVSLGVVSLAIAVFALAARVARRREIEPA
jgi:MFS transporter, Spinster family, sphingosine-1-phosphate transporter